MKEPTASFLKWLYDPQWSGLSVVERWRVAVTALREGRWEAFHALHPWGQCYIRANAPELFTGVPDDQL